MEGIINNLKDPSWWFSVFFIAIFVSVIAGFLKDSIEKTLGSFFYGLKAWRVKREEARAKLIEAIIVDRIYFEIVMFRTLVVLILFVLSTIMFLSLPVLLATIPDASSHIVSLVGKNNLLEVFGLTLGLFNVIIGYRTSRILSLALQLTRVYRKCNGLPKLF